MPFDQKEYMKKYRKENKENIKKYYQTEESKKRMRINNWKKRGIIFSDYDLLYDIFINTDSGVRTKTNNSGGIQGGISNGEDIYFNVAFKPIATLLKEQQTVDKDKNETTINPKGRHDPCVLPRAVPIVESMAALVLADHFLMSKLNNI